MGNARRRLPGTRLPEADVHRRFAYLLPFLVVVLLLGACATAPPRATEPAAPSRPALSPIRPTDSARVVRVVDGDTIIVRLGGRDVRVRYIGMDAPESVRPSFPVEPFGPEAAKANRALVEGRVVELERDVSEVDQFDRLLRYVWLHDGEGWTLVNLELVTRGYASILTIPPDVRLADELLAAERAARAAGRGLWSQAGGSPTP